MDQETLHKVHVIVGIFTFSCIAASFYYGSYVVITWAIGMFVLAALINAFIRPLVPQPTNPFEAWSDEIDEERAQQAMQRAQERLASRTSDMELERAMASLRRAQVRVNLVQRRRPR